MVQQHANKTFRQKGASLKSGPILIGFFLSGIAALIYEAVWTKELALVFGSTSYALSTVLSSFMMGLAIGSFIGGRVSKKRDAKLIFGVVQVGLCVTAILLNVIIDDLSSLFALIYYPFKGMPGFFLSIQFVAILCILLIPTILMGMTLPLAVASYTTSLDNVAEDIGKLYGINTLGCVLGAVMSGFAFIPLLGLNNTVYVASCCNFLAAVIVLQRRRHHAVAVSCFILATLLHFFLPPQHYYFNLYNANRTPSYDAFKMGSKFFGVVWRKDDKEGTVVVTKGLQDDRYALSIRGKPEGTSADQKNYPLPVLMAQLLLAYRPDAKTFLKIGLGTGETVMAASATKTLERIEVVEINSAVIEASKRFFYPQIHNDRRIKFITSDARKYLLLNSSTYDIISSQATDPTDESSGFLFTREYFSIVRSRLGTDGIYGMFLPTYVLGERGADIIVKTFATVFPYCYSWRILDIPFLIASVKPLSTSPEAILKRIEEFAPGQAASLRFASGPETLQEFARSEPVPLNTDDRPVVEFIAAKNLMN